MKVTCCATWMSASSIEKIDEGDGDRDLKWAFRRLRELLVDDCINIVDAN